MPLFIFQFVTLCTIPLIDISFQTHLSVLNIPSLFCWKKKQTNRQPSCSNRCVFSSGFVELSRHLWHRPSLDVDQTRIDSLEGWESCQCDCPSRETWGSRNKSHGTIFKNAGNQSGEEPLPKSYKINSFFSDCRFLKGANYEVQSYSLHFRIGI